MLFAQNLDSFTPISTQEMTMAISFSFRILLCLLLTVRKHETVSENVWLKLAHMLHIQGFH